MVMPIIEASSLPMNATKFAKASRWWRSKTEAEQRSLIRVYKIVTWAHVITVWEKHGHEE